MQTLKAKETKQSQSNPSVIMEANSTSPEITLTPTVAGKPTAGTQPPCRWNPTKDQINMLENFYKQGLRTPTAEQIQEITTKLQTFGHIEGKNVFYWFQNHKARQRQKQKQDHISYFNQYLHYHHHHPHHHHVHQPAPAIFPVTHHPNVVYGQCYMPQSELGFYNHYPKMLLPSATTIKRSRSPRIAKPNLSAGVGTFTGVNNLSKSNMVNGKTYQETLDLFPLHPTGVLQQKEASATDGYSCATDVLTSSSADRSRDQLYFDFFSG